MAAKKKPAKKPPAYNHMINKKLAGSSKKPTKKGHVSAGKALQTILANPSKAAATPTIIPLPPPKPWIPPPSDPLAPFDTSPEVEWFFSVSDLSNRKRKQPTKLEDLVKVTPALIKRFLFAVSLGQAPDTAALSIMGVAKGTYRQWISIGRQSLDANESSPFRALFVAVEMAQAHARGIAEIEVAKKHPLQYLQTYHRSQELQLRDEYGRRLWYTLEGDHTTNPEEAAKDENGLPMPITEVVPGFDPPKSEFIQNIENNNNANSAAFAQTAHLELDDQQARNALEHLADLGIIALTPQTDAPTTRLTRPGGNGQATTAAKSALDKLAPPPAKPANGAANPFSSSESSHGVADKVDSEEESGYDDLPGEAKGPDPNADLFN